MSEAINENIYKRIDQDRIKKALENGNFRDALVLFNYSSLSKEEFSILQQRYTNYAEQMKEYSKQQNKERIEKAFLDNQDKAAEYIYKTSELTETEFNEIKRRVIFLEKPKIEQVLRTGNRWSQVLEILSNKITKPSFDTWLKETEAIIEENQITVYAKNDFQRDWLEERYRNIISITVEQVLGKEFDILFKV